jgi:hypothetical protein
MFQNINEQSGLPDFVKKACVNALAQSLYQQNIPSIYLEMSPFRNTTVINNVEELNNLRDMEIVSQSASFFNVTKQVNFYTVVDYSNSYFYESLSRHLLGIYFLVGLVIIVGTIVINYDTTNLVLKPIAVGTF